MSPKLCEAMRLRDARVPDSWLMEEPTVSQAITVCHISDLVDFDHESLQISKFAVCDSWLLKLLDFPQRTQLLCSSSTWQDSHQATALGWLAGWLSGYVLFNHNSCLRDYQVTKQTGLVATMVITAAQPTYKNDPTPRFCSFHREPRVFRLWQRCVSSMICWTIKQKPIGITVHDTWFKQNGMKQ